ncbi:MAG: cytochrome ubiquinol oxidase subunit I [Candidatus Neomarinimicrobiota bacterium]
MDVLLLSRLQFAVTIGFHYIYPPLSIGLGVLLVLMEALYLRTGNQLYHQMSRFWVRIFGLTFAVGVATGIVMEFEFGTNWSAYSRYVGDIFGSALAAEGVFAFFLESGFLAILLFGWDKVSPKFHFFSTVMVALGAHFSAVWIIVANSWQQTPAGYHIVGEGLTARAEITDFWAMVFNPSTVDRLTHTIMGAWQAGAFLVISVAAWYLLNNRHREFALASLRLGLAVAVVASLGQLLTGHSAAQMVAEQQPAKLAAFEGHYDAAAPGDMYLLGWVDEQREQVTGIKVPGMLSWLIYGDPARPVTGLRQFTAADRPPVNLVFQAYHLMIICGMALIGISLIGSWYFIRKTLGNQRWLLLILVASVLLPQIANQLGWLAAEVGRQPWIVYNLLRTAEGLSPVVSAPMVLTSLILFSLIYLLLFVLFLFLLNRKIQHGPTTEDLIRSTQGADR